MKTLRLQVTAQAKCFSHACLCCSRCPSQLACMRDASCAQETLKISRSDITDVLRLPYGM